jgi:hypothetical protein
MARPIAAAIWLEAGRLEVRLPLLGDLGMARLYKIISRPWLVFIANSVILTPQAIK